MHVEISDHAYRMGSKVNPYKLSVLFLELFAELANSVVSVSDSWIVQNLWAIIADLSDEII